MPQGLARRRHQNADEKALNVRSDPGNSVVARPSGPAGATLSRGSRGPNPARTPAGPPLPPPPLPRSSPSPPDPGLPRFRRVVLSPPLVAPKLTQARFASTALAVAASLSLSDADQSSALS